MDTGQQSLAPNYHDNILTETENVRSAWGLSYAALGATVGGAAGSYINGIFDGAKVGLREGAHLGQLAFQDILLPSQRPDSRTPYLQS